jgi:hypothetical protein
MCRSAIVQCVLINPSGATKQALANSGEGGGGEGGGGLGGGGERADEIRAESQNLGREVEMVHVSIAAGRREGGGGDSEGCVPEEYIVHSPGVYLYVYVCVCVSWGGRGGGR